MAKKETDEAQESEQPKESPMANAVDPHAGLVKMHKADRTIHAHPTAVKEHEKNGWKLA
jgi:hypothetical protein